MALRYAVGWLFAPSANIAVLSPLLVQPWYMIHRALPKIGERLTMLASRARTAKSAAVEALPAHTMSTVELDAHRTAQRVKRGRR